MVFVKSLTREGLQSRKEMAKNLTAVYKITYGMKRVNRYSPFHTHTT